MRVREPVDPDEEMSAVSYLLAKRQPSPAVLFESAKGFERNPLGVRLLWNILGPSLKRTALSLEEPADTPTVELIRRVKEKFKTRIPPREVARSEAPIYEHTLTGNDIDLSLLPIPKHWPLDGGRYAGTADAVITRDPDNGYLNVGTYRMMVQGPVAGGAVSLARQGRAAAHHPRVAEGRTRSRWRPPGVSTRCSCSWGRRSSRRTSPSTSTPAA